MSGIVVGFIGIGLTLVLQLITGIWWAATITERLRQVGLALNKLIDDTDAKVSKLDEDNDKAHKLLWARQDELKNRVSIIETRCEANHNG